MIDVKTIAAKRKALLKEYVEKTRLNEFGQKTIRVIQYGDDPASNAYIKGKKADCEEIGIGCDILKLPINENISAEQNRFVEDKIYSWSSDPNTLGIILQKPAPKYSEYLDEFITVDALGKDLDGALADSKYTPCTAVGVKILLDELGFNPDGKLCMVVGRGDIAGRPVAEMLEKMNATVIRCNSHTKLDIMSDLLYKCDLLVSATGVPGLFGRKVQRNVDFLGSKSIGIDIGIHRGEDGKLKGDISKTLYADDKRITPVPGGMGLMTRVGLLENAVYGPELSGASEKDIREMMEYTAAFRKLARKIFGE